MVRRLALVLLFACGACGNKPEPATGPAGTVVALEGEAWAQRGETERRALTLKSEVWNDDVVTTADKATVKIQLRHNDVVWTLEGG